MIFVTVKYGVFFAVGTGFLDRVLLHAVYIRHETDGFTSPLKEVRATDFSPVKIHCPRPDWNPQWVPCIPWQAR
jgi:hypothetical protein